MPEYLSQAPRANAFARVELPRPPRLAAEVTRRWPAAAEKLLAGDDGLLATLPIDHAVAAVSTRGGSEAGDKRLQHFLKTLLRGYPEDRNQPAADATSGLSPYLHFGHISSHEIFHQLAAQEEWSAASLGKRANGKRSGWWGHERTGRGVS